MATGTPNDGQGTLSDREFLTMLATYVEGIAASVDALADAREMDRKQLDHIDTMVHEITQFVDEHKPALNRALSFLEPGKSWRDYLKGRHANVGDPD
jgi:hypothetical protein